MKFTFGTALKKCKKSMIFLTFSLISFFAFVELANSLYNYIAKNYRLKVFSALVIILSFSGSSYGQQPPLADGGFSTCSSTEGWQRIRPNDVGLDDGGPYTGSVDASAFLGLPAGSVILEYSNARVRNSGDSWMVENDGLADKATITFSGTLPVRIRASHGPVLPGSVGVRDGILSEDGIDYSTVESNNFNSDYYQNFRDTYGSGLYNYFVEKTVFEPGQEIFGGLNWYSQGFATSLSYYSTSDSPTNNFSIFVCTPESDLEITKTVDKPTPNVGDEITFTLTATNNGPDDAPGVVVTDMLPSGYTFVSANPSEGTYDSGTGIWTIGDLADGDSETLEITATVNATGDYTNVATISGDYSDPDPDNNEDTEEVTPQQADLAITKTVDDATPNVGDDVTFTITVTNNGPDEATGVQITDELPAGLTYVSDNSGGDYDNTSGVWTVGTIANAGTATLEITATVTEAALPSADNIATITDSDQYDPDETNNTDNQEVTPQQSDLAIEKTVDPDEDIWTGDEITFTITVTNHGPADATGVVVNDQILSGFSYDSHSATDGTFDPVTGMWTIGDLDLNDSATLDITVTVNSDGDYRNMVSVSANEFDIDLFNNYDSIEVEVRCEIRNLTPQLNQN